MRVIGSCLPRERQRCPASPLGAIPPCCLAFPHSQEFPTSQLLPALGRRYAAASLLAPPLHGPLLELLKLEKKCIKWWAGLSWPAGGCSVRASMWHEHAHAARC